MSATEILALSARAATAAVASGALSEEELFRAYLARAEDDRAAGDHGLNCFTWVAEQVPSNGGGSLRGLPLAVKDLFCTEGIPSQSGSRILEGYRPPYTASVVSALQSAGAS